MKLSATVGISMDKLFDNQLDPVSEQTLAQKLNKIRDEALQGT